eukprot:g47256.t1
MGMHMGDHAMALAQHNRILAEHKQIHQAQLAQHMGFPPGLPDLANLHNLHNPAVPDLHNLHNLHNMHNMHHAADLHNLHNFHTLHNFPGGGPPPAAAAATAGPFASHAHHHSFHAHNPHIHHDPFHYAQHNGGSRRHRRRSDMHAHSHAHNASSSSSSFSSSSSSSSSSGAPDDWKTINTRTQVDSRGIVSKVSTKSRPLDVHNPQVWLFEEKKTSREVPGANMEQECIFTLYYTPQARHLPRLAFRAPWDLTPLIQSGFLERTFAEMMDEQAKRLPLPPVLQNLIAQYTFKTLPLDKLLRLVPGVVIVELAPT